MTLTTQLEKIAIDGEREYRHTALASDHTAVRMGVRRRRAARTASTALAASLAVATLVAGAVTALGSFGRDATPAGPATDFDVATLWQGAVTADSPDAVQRFVECDPDPMAQDCVTMATAGYDVIETDALVAPLQDVSGGLAFAVRITNVTDSALVISNAGTIVWLAVPDEWFGDRGHGPLTVIADDETLFKYEVNPTQRAVATSTGLPGRYLGAGDYVIAPGDSLLLTGRALDIGAVQTGRSPMIDWDMWLAAEPTGLEVKVQVELRGGDSPDVTLIDDEVGRVRSEPVDCGGPTGCSSLASEVE